MSSTGQGAVFRIIADEADLNRVLGTLPERMKRIGVQVVRVARDTARESDRVNRDSARAKDRTLQDERRAAIRAANEKLRLDRQVAAASKAEEAKRVAASVALQRQRSSALYAIFQREESEKTRATERAERDRTRIQERADRQRTQASLALDRQRSAALYRQHRQGERDEERAQGRAGRFVSGVAAGVASFASNAHGMVQDARQRRATTDRTLGSAFYQAGAGRSDMASLNARVHAFAVANRLDSADVAEGLNAAQTEFSSLGTSRSTQGERSANLETALQDALLARNTGQNTAEVMRVSGMLGNAGVQGPQRRSMLLALTGMAQRGAIELGAVSRTAMAPMQARIGQALAHLGQGATDDQRQHATQSAVMETFAEMEVGRGLGYSPRMMGNIMSGLENSLRNTGTQSKMLHNLRAAHNAEAERVLFDEHGALRGEFQSGIGLARGLQTAFHGDSTAMQNAFAGTGAGNAQSLQANQRRVLAGFMGEANDNVRRMVAGAGTDFTEDDVRRGGEIFGNDDASKLISDRENREQALVGNTTALNNLSNAIQSFGAANPLLAVGTNAVGGGLTSAIGQKLLGGGAPAATGPAAVSMAARIAAAGSSAVGTAGAGATALAGLVGGAIGIGAGVSLTNDLDRANRHGTGQATSPGNEITLFNIIKNAITEGMSSATVSVSPHDAAQAAAQAASGANAPPPEARH